MDIIYVTPDGQAFSGSSLKAWSNKVAGVWEAIKKAFAEITQRFIDSVKKHFRIKEAQQKEYRREAYRRWNIHWDTTRKSQVTNRQPLVTSIRSQL